MPSKNRQKEPRFDRRRFLTRSASTCALAATAGLWGYSFFSSEPIRLARRPVRTLGHYRVPPLPGRPQLAVVHGKDVARMARAAVDALGGISHFVRPGEKVLLKPNVGWDRQPELAANTNPELVAAMVALCRQAGAARVWVSDVSINDSFRSFARSGIEAASKRSGGSIFHVRAADLVPTDLKGTILGVWPVHPLLHQADRVINLPVVKHHSLSRCTIAMKNWFGILGGQRNRLHQEVHQAIVDLADAVRPTLTVIDATRVLVRNGPTGGSLTDVAIENTLVAGTDEVALDSYCLGFLGLTPAEVPFLGLAKQRGLGNPEWRALERIDRRL